jgi:hypothetical protein
MEFRFPDSLGLDDTIDDYDDEEGDGGGEEEQEQEEHESSPMLKSGP